MKYSLFLTSGLLATISTNAQTTSDRPNIILIVADDMGWGDMSFRGTSILKTPHLDEMSRDGVVMDRFYSASAVSAPTRVSLMTGSSPLRAGMTNCCTGHIRNALELLSEYFNSRGYTTGHFGKWHLGTLTRDTIDFPDQGRDPQLDYSPPWDNGFDICFSTHNVVPTWNPMEVPDQGGDWGSPRRLEEGWWGQHYFDQTGKEYPHTSDMFKGDDSKIIMDKALPFIKSQVESENPFFAYIAFHTPHTPTVAGGEFLEMYADHEARHHYGAISAMDAQIGRLRAHLEELGVSDNTLIWFTSDNGAAKHNPRFGDYGGFGSNGPFRGWKAQLYEGGIRVPSLLVYPQELSAKVITTPVCSFDVYPTLVDIIWGKQPSQPKDGISIVPYLDGKESLRNSDLCFVYGGKMVIMDDRYKLHYSPKEGVESIELYDLIEDHGETTDIADKKPEVVTSMYNELLKWESECIKERNTLINKPNENE